MESHCLNTTAGLSPLTNDEVGDRYRRVELESQITHRGVPGAAESRRGGIGGEGARPA